MLHICALHHACSAACMLCAAHALHLACSAAHMLHAFHALHMFARALHKISVLMGYDMKMHVRVRYENACDGTI